MKKIFLILLGLIISHVAIAEDDYLKVIENSVRSDVQFETAIEVYKRTKKCSDRGIDGVRYPLNATLLSKDVNMKYDVHHFFVSQFLLCPSETDSSEIKSITAMVSLSNETNPLTTKVQLVNVVPAK